MTTLRTAPVAELRTDVGVLLAHGEWCVIALRAFAEGETILTLAGESSSAPTKFTVQIAADEHLGIAPGTPFDRVAADHPWQFLNHSCRPNTFLRGRELVAGAPVALGEELAFDYETTEWDMAEPFRCRCGGCDDRLVRGFRWLDRAERERRRPWLARHLLERIDE